MQLYCCSFKAISLAKYLLLKVILLQMVIFLSSMVKSHLPLVAKEMIPIASVLLFTLECHQVEEEDLLHLLAFL
jgi:hypothetical protein